MKIIDIQGGQGSEAWLTFRAGRFGSSEAAAMLGLSEHCTRSELLRIKHTGLEREFGDWVRRNVLDKGHAVEASTRPMIEAQIDDTLYPVTCQGEGRLAASCDGLTMDGALAWECKQWNDRLAAEVSAGRVPDTHMPQCQHILLVTGADRLRFTVSDGTGERLVSTEVLPSSDWFQRLRDGWARFEQDLAAYTAPTPTEPTPVGRAPDTLPALRIELTGRVTASNLAEFKQTALGAIRSVNRTLKTDADFADAEKAVKWCADVEARLKAAKEHALSQTASIDELFRTLDDIAAESKAARLDLDKLVTRRKTEVKEEAVAAARRALDLHISAVNAEVAPMRLLPVAADFAGAIKGKRSIDSMQDALDTMLAGAKITADAQGRAIRANVAVFKERAAGMEALFADLHTLVHKPADDFAALVQARIDMHRAAEAAKEAARQAAEAQRIAAAEQRAREQEAARIAEQQRQQAEAERQAAAAMAAAAKKDDEGQHPQQVLKAEPATADATDRGTAANVSPGVGPMGAGQAADAAPTEGYRPAQEQRADLSLGTICGRLGFTVSAAFLLDALHVAPARTDKRTMLYTERQFGLICHQLQIHVGLMAELYAAEGVQA